MTTIRTRFAPVAMCLALGLAACGDDSTSTTTEGSATDETSAPVDKGYDRGDYGTETSDDAPDTSATDATDTTDHPEGDDVMLADSPLGQILVDRDGMTLYIFASDPPDTVTCTGGCAGTWPPLLAADDDIDTSDELDEDLFTLVDVDGGQQWSFNGHPLYYYAGDSAPGDTNGQGVGGVWFVVDAEGNAVTP